MGKRERSARDARVREPRGSLSRVEVIEGIVRGVVSALVKQRQDQKEATHELVARVLDCLKTGACPDPTSGPPFRRWIEWRCRDWLRRERIRKVRPLEVVPQADLAAPDASTPLRGRDLAFLSRWIDELPNEHWKEAVRLRYFEALNSREIGEMLGRPCSTVRSDLKRARDDLRHRHKREGRRVLEGESLE